MNGAHSSMSDVVSGVPQGTVLGPILFLIYINDIMTDISSNIRLFADDREIHSSDDAITLQRDLDTLHAWSTKWQMHFNVMKCAIMTVTKKKRPLDHAYSMNNEIIPWVTSHDYLGVTISHNLSWNKQCDKVHSKASRTLGLIRRTLHAAPPPVKKRAYEALVRPTLEYVSAAWSPHTQAKIKKIEQVQRSAARFIHADYRRTSSVTSMIDAWKWDTLATRRLFHDATLFYQVHHSLMKIAFPDVVVPAYTQTRHLHQMKYRIIGSTGLTYKNAFFVRMIPVWNLLPEGVVSAATVPAFQRAAYTVLRQM